MKSDTYDVIVIGAGMVGAACAAMLSEAGQRVLSIDARPVGSMTTGRGMGHISVTPEKPELLSLTAYSRRLWQRLLAEMDVDPEWLCCGTLWLAREESSVEALEARLTRLRGADVYAEMVVGRALSNMEPNLCGDLAGALLVPSDLVITPARVAGALIEASQRRGARTMIGFEVERVEPGMVRLTGGQTIKARAVVIAGGYLSKRLVPGAPLRPRKGHIVVAEVPHAYCFHQLIEIDYLRLAHASEQESVAFNVQPRPNGRVWVGSSRQYEFSGDEVEPEVVERMMDRAAEFMPSIRTLKVLSTRAGFRPATRDALPLIGPVPSMPGVYIATGHEGVGITASMGTARLITDQIVGRASEIDATPFLPSRFGTM